MTMMTTMMTTMMKVMMKVMMVVMVLQLCQPVWKPARPSWRQNALQPAKQATSRCTQALGISSQDPTWLVKASMWPWLDRTIPARAHVLGCHAKPPHKNSLFGNYVGKLFFNYGQITRLAGQPLTAEQGVGGLTTQLWPSQGQGCLTGLNTTTNLRSRPLRQRRSKSGLRVSQLQSICSTCSIYLKYGSCQGDRVFLRRICCRRFAVFMHAATGPDMLAAHKSLKQQLG